MLTLQIKGVFSSPKAL